MSEPPIGYNAQTAGRRGQAMTLGYLYEDGTSGHSGSTASEDRIHALDERGVTSRNQRRTLGWLRNRARYGATQAELQTYLEVGHGTASQVLSTLHQAGWIERLQARRLNSHVYCLPEYVAGRPTSGYRRLVSRQVLRERIAALEAVLTHLLNHPTDEAVRAQASQVLADRIKQDDEPGGAR